MASSAIQGVTAIQSAYVQSQAMRAQGEYDRKIGDLNADRMENEAKAVAKKGQTDATRRETNTRKTEGAQRAAMAAQGVALDSESASNVLEETAAIGAADVAAIQTNAWRNVWGIKSEADMTRTQGRMAERAKRFAARQTMITGGLTAIAHGYKAVESAASGGAAGAAGGAASGAGAAGGAK